MHPLDLHAERDRRDRAARRALRRELRLAALNATPAEIVGLEQLADDVQAGTITPTDARAAIARCRDDQRARALRAA